MVDTGSEMSLQLPQAGLKLLPKIESLVSRDQVKGRTEANQRTKHEVATCAFYVLTTPPHKMPLCPKDFHLPPSITEPQVACLSLSIYHISVT